MRSIQAPDLAADAPPNLSTERLLLRPLHRGDLSELLTIFGDPEVTRYWSSPPLTGNEEAEQLLQEIHQGFADSTLLQWGVADRKDDRVLGTCTLTRFSRRHLRAEVGYALARDAWGQGYAREAVTRVLRFAFLRLGLHRIEADVDPRNTPSVRLLKQLGFRREGRLRQRYRMMGAVQDALIFGLLATDTAARKLCRAGEV